MKRLLTKYGVIVLSLAVVIAVILRTPGSGSCWACGSSGGT